MGHYFMDTQYLKSICISVEQRQDIRDTFRLMVSVCMILVDQSWSLEWLRIWRALRVVAPLLLTGEIRSVHRTQHSHLPLTRAVQFIITQTVM